MKIAEFIEALGIDFYTGVPDSLLRPLCDYLYNTYGLDNKHHVVAANEGNAAAIGAGYHLATGKVPAVYLQNSGEGNIINPLASLLSEDIYGIPVLFIIGWRGEPGVHDEPQHVRQGKVTLMLLETMGVPYVVVDKGMTAKELEVQMQLLRTSFNDGQQAALVICKGALINEHKNRYANDNPLTREEIIQSVTDASGNSPIVSTTGKASRELFEYRETTGQGHRYDFLTVGSMGHSSSIALGIALQKPEKEIWCLDGDGAAIMHMGAMAVLGSVHPENLIHVIIDNGAHESVGGMPTAARYIDFEKIAQGCGYDQIYHAADREELETALAKIKQEKGLRLLIAQSAIGARKDLGRPTITPRENKTAFMKCLGDTKSLLQEKQLTSIIILSYNGLEYTQLCVESIRQNTKPGTYEIIVVDNASTDGSAEWLASQQDIRCILNKENAGFPKGCNQGLEIAKGTDLLLLNNDTIVTPGWLDNMLTALHSRAYVGAVGCLTNYCSNGQTISLPYQSIEELMTVAEKFNKSDAAKWHPWFMLVGYCLLFKREVYQQLGGLDEAFSPGNYEDDDYCLRMRKAGYELFLCADTYIHHFGSVSFGGKNDVAHQKGKQERYLRLLEKNRAYFYKKWDIKGGYRDHHEMTNVLYKELKNGQDVLIVNCALGSEFYLLNRVKPGLSLYGLTYDKLGEEVTGKTFSIHACEDFREGLEKYYGRKKFARIALLGNYQERPQADELIKALQQHLTADGLLLFGDKERIYRMQIND